MPAPRWRVRLALLSRETSRARGSIAPLPRPPASAPGRPLLLGERSARRRSLGFSVRVECWDAMKDRVPRPDGIPSFPPLQAGCLALAFPSRLPFPSVPRPWLKENDKTTALPAIEMK